MDVFRLHEQVISDYSAFTRSFVDIEDKRISEEVDAAIEQGLLWPDPWIQLNPMFEAGDSTDELVDQGVLHEECRKVFAIKRTPEDVEFATLTYVDWFNTRRLHGEITEGPGFTTPAAYEADYHR